MNDFLVYICAGGSVGLFSWSAYSTYQHIIKHTRVDPERGVWIQSVLFRILIPLAQPFAVLFGMYAERLTRRETSGKQRSMFLSMRTRLRRSLIAAGSPEGITPDEFLGLIVVSMLTMTAAGAAMFGLLSWRGYASFGLSLWLLLALLGVILPLLWLRDKLKSRKMSISRALPYALDLLTLGVESGLDFTATLAKIIKKLGDQPLAYEFAELLRQIRMGRPRADALRDLGERVDVPELTSVVGSLIQADELGASLGPVLRILSEQIRVRRSQRAEKLASEVPVKMLFPLVCFIFPTLFIMIFGMIFLSVYYG